MPARCVSLASGGQFRDVGGYCTRSGALTRWRMLYRASELSAPTTLDIDVLRRLCLTAVVDLRSDDEVLARPCDPWARLLGIRVRRFPLNVGFGSSASSSNVYEFLEAVFCLRREAVGRGPSDNLVASALDWAESRQLAATIALCCRLLDYHRMALREVFYFIAECPGPLVVLCSAGKDRTGLVIALLLEALGVQRNIVSRDYELTNRTWATWKFDQVVRERSWRLPSPELAHRSRLAALLGVPRGAMEEVLSIVDEKYGSAAQFLEGIDVDGQALAVLRHKYLVRDVAPNPS